MRMGLQPHSPYTCGLSVYAAAAQLAAHCGVPVSTHLAETLEEIEFVRHGTGPLNEFLRRIGWEEPFVPLHLHPVDARWRERWVMRHLNDIEEHHLRLAAWRTTVGYCPRASAYFGHPLERHAPYRHRVMLAAGINVALGTDSILCLDTPDRLSVLDEMRLAERDGTEAHTLLAMGTVNGAAALGLDPRDFTLAPGAVARHRGAAARRRDARVRDGDRRRAVLAAGLWDSRTQD